MSLLLLFPNDQASTGTGTGTGWTVVICPGNTWNFSECEQKSTWGEWSLNQWNQIYDSPATTNKTWGYMAGFTFLATTCSPTTWVATTC